VEKFDCSHFNTIQTDGQVDDMKIIIIYSSRLRFSYCAGTKTGYNSSSIRVRL